MRRAAVRAPPPPPCSRGPPPEISGTSLLNAPDPTNTQLHPGRGAGILPPHPAPSMLCSSLCHFTSSHVSLHFHTVRSGLQR